MDEKNMDKPIMAKKTTNKKSLGLFAAGLLTLASLFPGRAGAQGFEKQHKFQDPGGYLFINGGMGLFAEPNLAEITYTPESIRDVPPHSSDFVRVGATGPIKNKTLKYPPVNWTLESASGIGVRNENLDFRLGANLRYPILQIPVDDIERRNYTSAPGTEKRGYGAALTYYGIRDNIASGADALIPGVFMRIQHKSGKFFEYAIDLQNLDITTGYDRYNRLSTGTRHNLAKLTKHTLKVGVGSEDSQVFAGYVFTQRKNTALGEEAEFETPNHFVVGYQFRFGGKTK